MEISDLLFIIEIIGVISFALSGSILAMEKDCDLFGVIVLGVITATGGGIIRDILIGIEPPLVFVKPIYATIATIVSFIIFLLVYFKKLTLTKYRSAFDRADIILDSIGLSVFVIVGINTAISYHFDNFFLIQFIGVVTGVGGGILRDLMVLKVPMILRKRIYACAALTGGILYYLILPYNQVIALLVGIGSIIAIRLLAAHFKWNLPKAHLEMH